MIFYQGFHGVVGEPFSFMRGICLKVLIGGYMKFQIPKNNVRHPYISNLTTRHGPDQKRLLVLANQYYERPEKASGTQDNSDPLPL